MKITFSPVVVIWSAFTVMLEYCVWYSCHCRVFKVKHGSLLLVFRGFKSFWSMYCYGVWHL